MSAAAPGPCATLEVVEPSDELAALIAANDATLSPNDRRVADYLLEHVEDAALASADELAGRIGLSKAAVVRFGIRIGLGGFAGLQAVAARAVRRQLDPAAAAAPAAPADGVAERWHRAVSADLVRSLEATGSDAIDRAAAVLDSGEGWIHVFGQRASSAVAEYAYFLLNPILPNVVRVEAGESALADHLLDVGPEDRLLAVTFRRYAKVTTDVVSYFAEAGAASVLVTDSRGAPAAARATEVLVCADDTPGPFPTAVPGVFLLEVLARALVDRNPARAERRRGDAERVWGRFGTY
jgi:DNA-binding MurR/RpiR family transcriptional regulator